MKVTQIRVVPIQNHQRLKGTVTIVFDDVFKIRNIKLLPRKENKGLYVSFPDSWNKQGERFSVAFPVSKEFRAELEKAIIDEYYNVLHSFEATSSPKNGSQGVPNEADSSLKGDAPNEEDTPKEITDIPQDDSDLE